MTVHNGDTLTSASLPAIINRVREGQPAYLLCVKGVARRAFTVGKVYEPQHVAGGSRLVLREDDDDLYELGSDGPLSCWRFYQSVAEAWSAHGAGVKSRGAELQVLAQRFHEVHTFEADDLITFKEGLDDRKAPAKGEVAVVLEVLAIPVYPPIDTLDALSSPYVTARYDLIIGAWMNGKFASLYADSRRYRPFEGGQ